MRVQLATTCLVDTFFPETAHATVRLLKHFGVDVVIPAGQTCCGKPFHSSGYIDRARDAARRFMSVFSGTEPIVIPSGSCASMVKKHYPELFHDDPSMRELAEHTAARTYELTQFLVTELNATEANFSSTGMVTYHSSCQLSRQLGVREEPLLLLRAIQGMEFVPLQYAERCCGFGGSFMVKLPEVSMAMARDKAEAVMATGADTLTGCDHGCLMNISDALTRCGSDMKVKHIAQLLAEAL